VTARNPSHWSPTWGPLEPDQPRRCWTAWGGCWPGWRRCGGHRWRRTACSSRPSWTPFPRTRRSCRTPRSRTRRSCRPPSPRTRRSCRTPRSRTCRSCRPQSPSTRRSCRPPRSRTRRSRRPLFPGTRRWKADPGPRRRCQLPLLRLHPGRSQLPVPRPGGLQPPVPVDPRAPTS